MTCFPQMDRPLRSLNHLAFLLGVSRVELDELSKHADQFYAPFDKRQLKRGVWKERHIDNPRLRLKGVQKRIKERLLDPIPLPAFVCGGVMGRSTKLNAAFHVQQAELVALDIKNFFGSVTAAQVAKVWESRLGTAGHMTWLLTRLTTYEGHLPQGAPTSTALANLAMLPTLERLNAWCEGEGLKLSVFVDDISISGTDARRSIPVAIAALTGAGFKLARDKVKVMPRHMRQEVTGHTVNRRVSNGRALLKRTRSTVLRSLDPRATEAERRSAAGLLAHVRSTAEKDARWLTEKVVSVRTESAPRQDGRG